MIDKNLHKQINEISKLISYDRSLTLLEQNSSYDNNSWTSDEPQSSYDIGIGSGGMDTHDWTLVAELGLVAIGVILTATGVGAGVGIPLVGSVAGAAFATATVVSIGDALIYYKDGDNFTGSLMLGLSIIPGGELLSVLKKGKGLIKNPITKKYVEDIGEEGVQQLLKKSKDGVKLTKVEKEVLEYFTEQAGKEADVIAKLVADASKEVVKKTLAQKSLRALLGIVKFLGKTTVMIAGVPIGVDLLWLLATAPESHQRKIRDESDFGKLLDLLWVKIGVKNEKGIQEIKNDIIEDVLSDVLENPDILNIDATEGIKDLEDYMFQNELEKIGVYDD